MTTVTEELAKECDDVRNAVDLNGVVEDLSIARKKLKNVVERMDDVKDKEELKQAIIDNAAALVPNYITIELGKAYKNSKLKKKKTYYPCS